MGYSMRMVKASFSITNEKKGAALELLKQYFTANREILGYDNAAVLNSGTLREALDYCYYDIDENGAGDVYDIWFQGERMTADKEIFEAIAPAVTPGSYIEMVGEDGTLWRWVFMYGKCFEILPTITWE